MKVDPVTLLQMEDHRINIQPVIEAVVIYVGVQYGVLYRFKGVVRCRANLENKLKHKC